MHLIVLHWTVEVSRCGSSHLEFQTPGGREKRIIKSGASHSNTIRLSLNKQDGNRREHFMTNYKIKFCLIGMQNIRFRNL